MKVELKNLKVHKDMSEETECFSATIYIDGKKAAEVSNHGTGGPNLYHFSDRKLEKEFYDYCKSLPPIPASGGLPSLEMDEDLFIGNLMEKHAQLAWLKKKCKATTLFRLKGDEKGTWRPLKMAFSPELKTKLVAMNKDKLEIIANDNLEAAAEFIVASL